MLKDTLSANRKRLRTMTAKSYLQRLLVIAFLCVGAGSAQAHDALDPVETCRAWIDQRSWRAHEEAPETRVLSDRTACYDGMIERGSLDALHEWIGRTERADGESPTLVIRSGGGDAEVALGLAEKLQNRNARVFISEICASSCANFLYAGIRLRHVFDGALILFHGGYSGKSRASVMKELEDFLAGPHGVLVEDHDANRNAARHAFDAAAVRQDALFRRIGVDPAIVHGVDAIDFAEIDDRRCGGTSTLPRRFVYFDMAQMERLGIAPVTGLPETRPTHVNAAIAALDASFVACSAPEDVLSAK